MIYKGYEGVLEVDEEAGELFGTVRGLSRDGITFVGRTIDEARECFERSVDFYLERCAATGKDPERPYSGEIAVRVSSEAHRALAERAERRGMSADQFIVERLELAAKGGAIENDAPSYREVVEAEERRVRPVEIDAPTRREIREADERDRARDRTA